MQVNRNELDQEEFDFGVPERHRPTFAERLFFALLLDRESALLVDRFGEHFRQEQGLDGQSLQRERLHLSLHSLGDHKRLRSKTVYAARCAAATVALPAFDIHLSSIKTFDKGRPYRRPLVLLAESLALHDLHYRLGLAIRANGMAASASFAPHVTMSYGRDTIQQQPIVPICLSFKDFCLIHNERHHGQLGTYHVLGRWPLQASR